MQLVRFTRTQRLNRFAFECKQFAASQSGGGIQKNHYTKAVTQLEEQRSQFFWFQLFRDGLPLGTLAGKKDGVLALLNIPAE